MDDTAAVWDGIRATRSDPPTAATRTPERRRTYVSALEQAEQMFRAASTVGPATCPLLVFYGLSQAGRAIAAAAHSASGDDWKLLGHGITSKGLHADLPDVQIATGKAGDSTSFTRLSDILGSPLWGKSTVALHKLWDCLPENRLHPLREDGPGRRTPLYIDHRSMYSDPHPLASAPVCNIPPWVLDAPDSGKALNEYLVAFPGALDYESYSLSRYDPQSPPNFTRYSDGWGELDVNWKVPAGQERTLADRVAHLATMGRWYDGSLYFFPSLVPSQRGPHPLMAWWAVLHTLSMLARYQPAEWAAHIDVDVSRHAVPIERLLKRAIEVVPRLIAEAIDQVAAK